MSTGEFLPSVNGMMVTGFKVRVFFFFLVFLKCTCTVPKEIRTID